MARVRNPLFSQSAHGKYSPSLVYRRDARGHVVTKRSAPGSVNPFVPSAAQLSNRALYGSAVESWRALSQPERDAYDVLASGLPLSGWNYYLREVILGVPLAMDSFIDSDGTSLDAHVMDIGSGWTEINDNGDWQIQSNRATTNITTQAANVAYTDVGVADASIEVTVNTGDSVSGLAGLGVRVQDADNMWLVRPSVSGNALQIQERNGGVPVLRASTPVVVDPLTNYKVTAICDGDTITGFLDDGSEVSYGGASFLNTRTEFGLFAVRVMATDPTFNNFAVYSLPPS